MNKENIITWRKATYKATYNKKIANGKIFARLINGVIDIIILPDGSIDDSWRGHKLDKQSREWINATSSDLDGIELLWLLQIDNINKQLELLK